MNTEKLMIFFLVIATSVCVCVAQEDKAITERLNQKYEYVVYSEKSVCYYVYIRGKAGICDLAGNEIISCKYDLVIFDKAYGCFYVSKNGKFGAYDLSGKPVVPCLFDGVKKIGDHYAVAIKGIYDAYSPLKDYSSLIQEKSDIQEKTETPPKKNIPSSCIICSNKGICLRCYGTGKCPNNYCKKGYETMPYTSVPNVCHICKGNEKCYGCNGTRVCPYCKGASAVERHVMPL